MATFVEIEKKINDWKDSHPDNINTFVKDTIERLDNNKIQIIKELKGFVEYVELYDLKQIIFISYLDAKYHRNRIAIDLDKISLTDNENENIFYDWLKVCLNQQNDPNIDFYFKYRNIVKEDEVKKILFDNQGNLRDLFKNKDWQIRLRKMRTWFLKRYDWWTSIKLYQSLKDKKRRWTEFLDLVFPRILCSILLGYSLIIFNSDLWVLPLRLNLYPVLITIAFLILIYLIYECSKIIDGEKNTFSIFKRVLPIFILGVVFSFIFSSILYGINSCNFILFESFSCKENIDSSLRIISFFTFVAFSIGIIVQTIWEEKTITEPF